MQKLLEVSDLTVHYRTTAGSVKALDSVDVDIHSGEFLAIVGESGCGKTTLGLSIIGLLPKGSARYTSGAINYKGADLTSLAPNDMRKYRGSEIAMIFQEPLTSLNPLKTVGSQVAEAIVLRKNRSQGSRRNARLGSAAARANRFLRRQSAIPKEIESEVIAMLNLVRIADPSHVISRYPFELSGGMRQRVMIAMALSQQPALLIADEPTTALDVTTQAQVLKLMKEIKDKLDTTIVLVTHDLAVASQVADRVVVMYAGQIVEDSNVHELFSKPMHPYTQGLLSCIPRGDKKGAGLKPIPGSLPDLGLETNACKFVPRCPHAMEKCSKKVPPLIKTGDDHRTACFLYGE